MAYSDLDTDIVYTGDGATTVFPINFARTSDDQVVAELYNFKGNVADCRVASTENIDISTGGLLTVDGVTLSATDRVLLKDQTNAVENGLYEVAAGAWSRTSDADEDSEVVQGLSTLISEGVQAGKIFEIITANPITVGVTAITFSEQANQETFNNPNDWQIIGNDVVTSVALTDEQKILIYRDTSPTHETNYTEYEFPFSTMNIDLDRVYQLTQENKRELERCLKSPRLDYIEGNDFSYDDLSSFDTRISQNEADIATNTGNIATNAADIATNAGNIATNTSNIATNTANIATNSSDIATLQGQVGAIVTPNVVSITSAQTYAASNADVVILDTGDAVQVDLPAPASGAFVRVKGTADVSSKTVVSAAGIDGFGTTYTLSSEYESVSLVSDGTKWYII